MIPLPVEFSHHKLRELWNYFSSMDKDGFNREWMAHAMLFKEQKRIHAWLAMDEQPFAGFTDE